MCRRIVNVHVDETYNYISSTNNGISHDCTINYYDEIHVHVITRLLGVVLKCCYNDKCDQIKYNLKIYISLKPIVNQ